MRIDPDTAVKLIEHLSSLVGQTVVIHASLSRSRDIGGHDRHFATVMEFQMTLKYVNWFISGSRLSLTGDSGSSYEMTTDAMVVAHWDSAGVVEIIEQFETKLERHTRIIPQPSITLNDSHDSSH